MQVGMLETKNMSWKLLDKYYTISESISLDEIKSAGKTYITGNEPLVTILRPKMKIVFSVIAYFFSNCSS